MEPTTTDMPFLANAGMMLTYRCSVACPHCVVEAGPHRKEEIDADESSRWLDELAAYRGGIIRGLALTGGEPFYVFDKLKAMASGAGHKGFVISVVTNGYWARTFEDAISTLEKVPEISLLSLSTDKYHLRYIPMSNIRNAVAAAKELGKHYSIAVCTESMDSPFYQGLLADISEFADPGLIRSAITYPVGRAARNLRDHAFPLSDAPSPSACTMASSPIIYPDGRVNGCIGPVMDLPPGHPLYLGNARTSAIAGILDGAEMNRILHALRVWGPHWLVERLRECGEAAYLPKQFISDCICDACYKIFANERLCGALAELAAGEDFGLKVAYGRAYYLGEDAMLERMGAGRQG